MPKGKPNKRYTSEFKIKVVETMHKEQLSHCSTTDLKKHIYAPLIHLNADSLRIQVSPVPLNDGEMKFVELLNEYIKNNSDVLNSKELYLLRNKSKSGMGFFEAGYFYPYFVLWIKEPGLQKISFIDPKGLFNLMLDNPKIEFYKTIKELQNRLQSKTYDEKIILNSFFISVTPSAFFNYKMAHVRITIGRKNVLFLDNKDCIKMMISKIINDK